MLIAMVAQALLLKAAGAPKEKTAEVLAEALDMLQQDSTQYQVISTAVELLQKAKAHDIAVPGANLEVRKLHVLRTRLLQHFGCCRESIVERQFDSPCTYVKLMKMCKERRAVIQAHFHALQLQELLPLLEGNLAARSQAVRGATLNLLCTCPQPPLPQQGAKESSASDEPQPLSSIFPNLAHIENQVQPSVLHQCVHFACNEHAFPKTPNHDGLRSSTLSGTHHSCLRSSLRCRTCGHERDLIKDAEILIPFLFYLLHNIVVL